MEEETVEISGFSWEVTAQLLQEKIDRVRELHQPYYSPQACDCCPPDEQPDCTECNDYYPCKTIKALDGEQ